MSKLLLLIKEQTIEQLLENTKITFNSLSFDWVIFIDLYP